jgi:hypothetical protein
MKPGRGKAKGGAFEREMCKIISLWITNGEKEDCLWRSAMSGGRATVAHRKGKNIRQEGDLTAVAPEGHRFTDHYYSECKHVKDLALMSFLFKHKGILAKFWRKVQEEANRNKKMPVIFARQNGWPVLVIASYDAFYRVTNPDIYMEGRHLAIWQLDRLIQHPLWED